MTHCLDAYMQVFNTFNLSHGGYYFQSPGLYQIYARHDCPIFIQSPVCPMANLSTRMSRPRDWFAKLEQIMALKNGEGVPDNFHHYVVSHGDEIINLVDLVQSQNRIDSHLQEIILLPFLESELHSPLREWISRFDQQNEQYCLDTPDISVYIRKIHFERETIDIHLEEHITILGQSLNVMQIPYKWVYFSTKGCPSFTVNVPHPLGKQGNIFIFKILTEKELINESEETNSSAGF